MGELPPGVSNAVLIGVSALKHALERELPKEEEHDRDKVLDKAMELAHDDSICFLCQSDEEKFKIGVGGLLLYYKGDFEFEQQVTHDMRLLASLSAAMQGVPVDFAALVNDDDGEDKQEPLRLMDRFKKARDGK